MAIWLHITRLYDLYNVPALFQRHLYGHFYIILFAVKKKLI